MLLSYGHNRISELPESLIFKILCLLPTREVVKTAALSKKWRYLWTTAPSLNFDFRTEQLVTDDRLRNFINRTLILWRGERIQEFNVDLGAKHVMNKSLHSEFDVWVHFAKEHGVERLRLSVKRMKKEEVYWLPQCLYSCSLLTELYIFGCNIPVPTGGVSWNRLKQLKMCGYQVSEDLMKKVLMGCPSLEWLFLSPIDSHENLYIESSSLRSLFVMKFLKHSRDAPTTNTELRISAPNLEILKFCGVPYGRCSMKVPSIIRFTFFGKHYYNKHKLFSGNDFVVETFRQILLSIKYVAFLKLTDWSIKAFVAMKGKNMLPTFPSVVELKLEGCLEEYEQIVGLLEVFPQLDKIFLKFAKRNSHGGGEAAKFEARDLPNCFPQKLRTISITWDDYEGEDSVFPLIEILLKHASRLEKMVFQLSGSSSDSLRLRSASEKVQSMPRSSTNAEIVFF